MPCIECKNNFLKNNASLVCSSCYDSITHKLEKYNPKELGKLVDLNKKKKEKRINNRRTVTIKQAHSLRYGSM